MYTLTQTTNLEDACLVAHTWGMDDALEGLRPRAAEFFWLDTPQWEAYNKGYQEGVELLFHLTSSRTRRQLGIETERPHDFLTDAEDRRRKQRF